MRTPFTGCGTALVTPFTRGGELDEAAVRRLARRQIDAGIHFLVPCGTTARDPTLTAAERLRVVEIVVDEARGKVPVLAGAGGYDTHEVIESALEMARAGADGFLSVTPYYNKPTQEGLYPALPRHRQTPSAADRRLQRARPDRMNVDPATLARLAQIPNIVGVKEASGNVTQMCELCRAVPQQFPRALGRRRADAAADGDRRARYHFGRVERECRPRWSQMVEFAEADDFAAARKSTRDLLPLMQINFVESNPIPVKAAMAMMGLARGSLSAAAGPAEPGLARTHRPGAPRSRAATRDRRRTRLKANSGRRGQTHSHR